MARKFILISSVAALVGALSPVYAQTTYTYATDANAAWSAIQIGSPMPGDEVILATNLLGNRNITLDVSTPTVGRLRLEDSVPGNYWNITGAVPFIFDQVDSGDAVLEIVNSTGSNFMRFTAPLQLNDSLVVDSFFTASSPANRGRLDFDANVLGGGKTLTFNGISDFTYDQAGTAITDLAGFRWNSAGAANFANTTSLVNGTSGFSLEQGVAGGVITFSAPLSVAGTVQIAAGGYTGINLSGQISGATDLVLSGGGLQPKYVLSNNVEGNPADRNVVRITNSVANAFSGNVSVTGAGLLLDFTNNVTKVGSGSLTLQGASLLVDDSGSGTTTQSFAGLTLGRGESNLTIKRDSVNTTVSLGAIAREPGATAVFRYSTAPTGTNVQFTTTETGVNGILGGWAVLATSGVNADDFAGIGTGGIITAPGTNGAAGYTTLTAGLAGSGIENVSYTGGNLTRTVDLNANSLRWQNNAGTDATLTLGSTNVTIASGGLLVSNTGANGATNATISGTGLISAGSGDADLYVYTRNGRLTVTAGLIGAGNGALYKSGFGRLSVTADAAYTGGTWITGGVLDIGGVDGRLSSGNLRLSQGGQLGTSGTFSRAVGDGAGQVFFGEGGGGFSAEGGDLTVNLGGAGALLTRADIAGNLGLNNAYTSTGVVTLVNPLDTTGGVTVSVGANANSGLGRFQSNGGAAYARLAAGTTGSGDLQIFGGSANGGNPNNAHSSAGLLYADRLEHTGKTLINAAALYLAPTALGAVGPIVLTAGGQLASQGERTITLGSGPGEIQFVGTTFLNDGGFAAVGGDFTVTLNDGDTTIAPGANFAMADVALGNAFSAYRTTLTNNLTAGTTFNASGPGVTVYSGAMSGSGAINLGGNNPTAGVLLVTGANTFTGNSSSGSAAGIFRAGSAAAFGANGGDNTAGGGTFDLNGFDFSTENFNGGGNSSGTFDMGRVINSNTSSPATFGNLRLTDLFGGGAYLGGDGVLNFKDLTTSASLAQGGFFGWRGTGTLNYTGSNTGTYAGTNVQYRTTFQGGTVHLDYLTTTGAKLLSATSGSPTGTTATLVLANVNLNLTGNPSAAVTESVLDNGTLGGTQIDGGASAVLLKPIGQPLTLELNRISVANRGAINFSVDLSAGGSATATTDALNNSAGILGAWSTWARTDWAVNSAGTIDGAIGALATYEAGNDLSMWVTGDTALNRSISDTTTGTLSGNTRIGSLRFAAGAANATLDLGTSGLSLGAAAENGGILVVPESSGELRIAGGALNPGGGSLGTGDTVGNTTLYVHQNGSGILEIASKITGSTSAGLSKTGTGVLRLSGNNTYSGPTTISGGVVEITTLANASTSQSLGRGNEVQLFNGAALRLVNATDVVTNKRVQVGIGGGTLDLAGEGTTATFSGQNTTLASGVFNVAVMRLTDGELPDFTITGSGNAVFDGGIYLSTPDKAGNSGGGDFTRNLVDSATLSKFVMNGTGTVTVNSRLVAQGGTVVNAGTLVLGNVSDTLSNNAPLTVNSGGTVSIPAGNSDHLGALSVKGGIVTGEGSLKTLANFVESGEIHARLAGELAGLDKTTAGTATLTAANTYAGGTRVTGGKLLVNNATGSGTGAGDVYAGLSGTLAGTGSIAGAVTVAGTISPGEFGVESLTTGALTLLDGAALEFELGGTESDLLSVNGTATLEGFVSLNLSLTANPVDFTSFTLIDSTDGVEGLISGGRFVVGGNAIEDGGTFFVTSGPITQEFQLFYSDDGGNDVTLLAVPEPGAGVVLLGGLATVLGLRRRRTIAPC